MTDLEWAIIGPCGFVIGWLLMELTKELSFRRGQRKRR